MIMDETLEFADAGSVAAAAGTTVLGDVIDLGQTASDIGNGEEMFLVIQVATSIVAAGAGSLTLTLVSDSLSTLGAGVVANCTSHWARTIVTSASPVGLNVAGQTLAVIRLPMEAYERYLGILSTVATQTISAGAVDAFLTKDASKWAALADAIN